MACIKNFDPTLLSESIECAHKQTPWSIEGAVTHTRNSGGLLYFDINGHRMLGFKDKLPEWVKVGNVISVSFDGEKSRIELVNNGLVKNGVKTA